MALKTLMLRRSIDKKKAELEELRNKDAEFSTREAELETAISEANTADEEQAVTEAVDAFEADKTAHDTAKAGLEREIGELEADLANEEAKKPENTTAPKEERKDEKIMNIRDSFFGLDVQERSKLFEREDVKAYIAKVRSIMRRDAGDITNAQVLIPQVMLPYLRQVIEEGSKLLKHTNLQRIPGEGRMIIDGGFPEAVWTEMCGKLNELTLSYNDVEIGGYKVGGYVSVCNALLEDSDIALASDIITKLGQGIGYAVDKAIVYGTGTKMPLGIVTRLAQTTQPSDYPATARAWADLHTSNIISVTAANSTGIKLFQQLVSAAGAARNKFARGNRWWVMNETTKSKLVVEAMSINAAGAIVSGMGDTMPVIGGAIETLDFIPDNVIIFGYDGLYLMAERAGIKTGQSEHYLFTDDKTVFRGTARYDGKPVIAEGFVAIGINAATVSASAVTFAADTANVVNSNP